MNDVTKNNVSRSCIKSPDAMKTLLLTGCILSGNLFSQTAKAPALPKDLIRISTPQLQPRENDSNTFVLKMDFNGEIPRNRLQNIPVPRIESVTLVYTKYRLSESFDQLLLNARRMDRFYASFPALLHRKDIQWYWVEQTGCSDATGCESFFHGFVIKLREKPDEVRYAGESSMLDFYTAKYLSKSDTGSSTVDSLIRKGVLKLIKKCDTTVQTSRIRGNKLAVIRGWNEEYNKSLSRKLKRHFRDQEGSMNLLIDSRGRIKADEHSGFRPDKRMLRILNRELNISPARYKNRRIPSGLTVHVSPGSGYSAPGLTFTTKPLLHVLDDKIRNPRENSHTSDTFNAEKFLYQKRVTISCDYIDSATGAVHSSLSFAGTPDLILRVFDRNPQWKNCLVVTDVTGSMYPYLAQFRAWHKLNMSSGRGNSRFIFFNDGDMKPGHLKIVGKTGGIYGKQTRDYDSLSSVMKYAMKRGNGGDGPENNIEAVLEGLKQFPECKEVIMIADNWAVPRDLSILNRVKVPIRLILCGSHFAGFNVAYLELVRKNGGSIHTMEQDLYNLARLQEGQSFELDGYKYTIRNGHITLASKPLAAD